MADARTQADAARWADAAVTAATERAYELARVALATQLHPRLVPPLDPRDPDAVYRLIAGAVASDPPRVRWVARAREAEQLLRDAEERARTHARRWRRLGRPAAARAALERADRHAGQRASVGRWRDLTRTTPLPESEVRALIDAHGAVMIRRDGVLADQVRDCLARGQLRRAHALGVRTLAREDPSAAEALAAAPASSLEYASRIVRADRAAGYRDYVGIAWLLAAGEAECRQRALHRRAEQAGPIGAFAEEERRRPRTWEEFRLQARTYLAADEPSFAAGTGAIVLDVEDGEVWMDIARRLRGHIRRPVVLEGFNGAEAQVCVGALARRPDGTWREVWAAWVVPGASDAIRRRIADMRATCRLARPIRRAHPGYGIWTTAIAANVRPAPGAEAWLGGPVACAHTEGDWYRNSTADALLFGCPRCARPRIACLPLHRLPAAHPEYVALTASPHERRRYMAVEHRYRILADVPMPSDWQGLRTQEPVLDPARFDPTTCTFAVPDAPAQPPHPYSVEAQLARRRAS